MNRHRRTPPNLDFREHPSNHLLVDYDVFRMRHRPSVTYRPEVAANVVCANAIFKLHVGVVRDTSSRYGGIRARGNPLCRTGFGGVLYFRYRRTMLAIWEFSWGFRFCRFRATGNF